MSSTAAAETPTPKSPEPSVLEAMAREPYFQVKLAESFNPKYKHGSLYVGINDYSMFLPREESIMVCESIYKVLTGANATAYEYKDEQGNQHSSRRDDVVILEALPATWQDAHANRLSGKMPVFPKVLPGFLLTQLSAESAPTPSKKGT